MDQLYGFFLYGLSLLTMGGIYAILALGLNIQWGFTGLFNVGIAGFFAIGAYTTAILTTADTGAHLGGYGMPVMVGLGVAMVLSGVVAFAVGLLCIRLRSDYLAIATIGIGEILRLIIKNENWATNGPRGVAKIPRPFEALAEPWDQMAFAALVLVLVLALYLALERAHTAPWGRVMSAIRENEDAARAAGKNIERFRIEAFVTVVDVDGPRGRADRALHQVHRSQCDRAADHHVPRMGDADRRWQRQQPGRHPGGVLDLVHLVDDRDSDRPPARRLGDPSRLHPRLSYRAGTADRPAAIRRGHPARTATCRTGAQRRRWGGR